MVSKASEDLPEPRQAGDDHQLVARDLDGNIFQVMDARTDHANDIR
jgi:hypothetical protein